MTTLVLFGGQIDMKNQNGTFKTSMKNQSTLEPFAESIRDTLTQMRHSICSTSGKTLSNANSINSIANNVTTSSDRHLYSNNTVATLPANVVMKTFSDRFPLADREVCRPGNASGVLPVTLVSVFNTDDVLLSEDSSPEKGPVGVNRGAVGGISQSRPLQYKGLSLLNIPQLPGSDICVEW